MKILSFLSSLLLAVSLIRADHVPPTDSNVIVLGHNNFTSIVDPEPLMLVEFYAPWCGHCKALAPGYENAATTLLADNIKLAKVDCDAETNKDLCKSHKVQGYPTLKVFRSGQSADYNGGRSEDLIVSYMKKQSMPAISDIKLADLDQFSTKDRIVVVAYLPNGRNDASFPVFDNVAQAMRDDVLFGLTSDKLAASKLGVQDSPPGLVLYRTFDDPKVIYSGSSFTEDEIKKFIKAESLPTMDEVSPENFMEYVNSGLPLAFFFYDTPETRAKYGPGIEQIARKHKNKVLFVYCDAVKYGAHAEYLALQTGKWPAFAINEVESNQKWPFDQAMEPTQSNIDDFVTKYLNKEIPPFIKSQPIPKSQEGPVIEVVGDSFKDIVFDVKKDVFVKYYAPWCGHCKRLAGTWKDLAEAFVPQEDKVIFVKMDLTENDPPAGSGSRIEGFPTLRLYRAGDNEVIEYSGDRSGEDLAAFVAKHAKNKLTIPEILPSVETEKAEGKTSHDDQEIPPVEHVEL